MPSMKIQPFGDGETALEFQTWLDEAAMPYLELGLFTKHQSIVQDTDIISDLEMKIRVAGLFELAVYSEFYVSEDAFYYFSNPAIWEEDEDELLSYLASETKLGSLKIDMRDLGVRVFIEQTGELPPYPVMAEQLRFVTDSFLPETGPNLANATERFLLNGGALQLSATPSTPFRIEDFAAVLFMPDFVARQINLTATHTP